MALALPFEAHRVRFEGHADGELRVNELLLKGARLLLSVEVCLCNFLDVVCKRLTSFDNCAVLPFALLPLIVRRPGPSVCL